jgi:hypothetical protein
MRGFLMLLVLVLLGPVGCASRDCGVDCVAEEAGSSSADGSSTYDSSTYDSSTDDSDTDDSDTDDSDTDGEPPDVPTLKLSFSQVKQFEFSWAAVVGAKTYQLFESADVGVDFVQIGDDVVGESLALTMPLHFRVNASYQLRACNENGCSESAVVNVVGTLAEAVGYFKASNTIVSRYFGNSVALSGDGSTLAVGADGEGNNAVGINGNQANLSATDSGAVYVFGRDEQGQWSQQAYVKASNTDAYDRFGWSVALSGDGSTLAVGAPVEDSNAVGINGNQADNSASNAGAVYVFVRDGQGQWSQQAYVKASNTDADDRFGHRVALSGDGSTLAVGAQREASNAVGIDGDQADNSASHAGAVYVFVRAGQGQWSQQAYVKASNTDADDNFGWSVALSGDGSTLAVGAYGEASDAVGIDGNQADNSASEAGAVYMFVRNGQGQWSQQAYVKASNPDPDDRFGHSMALSGDGSTLAVGAYWEASNAVGIDGDQADNSASQAGAVYVFVRDGQGQWSQQAYVKASNTAEIDWFGYSVALSGDGSALAVGAFNEDSNAVGIDGDQADNSATGAGAVYVFVRDGQGQWSQQAYVKASNTDATDRFGSSVALSEDGSTLAVGAVVESSSAVGIGGNQADNSSPSSGAVYLY